MSDHKPPRTDAEPVPKQHCTVEGDILGTGDDNSGTTSVMLSPLDWKWLEQNTAWTYTEPSMRILNAIKTAGSKRA